jgi:hypothetical protein
MMNLFRFLLQSVVKETSRTPLSPVFGRTFHEKICESRDIGRDGAEGLITAFFTCVFGSQLGFDTGKAARKGPKTCLKFFEATSSGSHFGLLIPQWPRRTQVIKSQEARHVFATPI